MSTVIIAVLLVAAAVGVLGYVATLLGNAAAPSLIGVWERQRFDRRAARARRGDALQAGGDIDGALRVWREAFYLRPVSNRDLATAVTNHHTALLSRLLALTSDLQAGSVRLLSLAKADRLLAERNELQRRYVAARQSGRRDRLREALALLRTNSVELEATLGNLVNEVRLARQPKRTH